MRASIVPRVRNKSHGRQSPMPVTAASSAKLSPMNATSTVMLYAVG